MGSVLNSDYSESFLLKQWIDVAPLLVDNASIFINAPFEDIMRKLCFSCSLNWCLVGAFILGLVSLVSAADKKTVKNSAGNCSISVPADWTVEASFGMANSADKKMSAVVSSPKYGGVTFGNIHQMAPTMYPDDKITKDTSSEFQMEGKSGNGKPNVYRAVPAGAKACIVEVQYDNGDAAGAMAIATSLAPAK